MSATLRLLQESFYRGTLVTCKKKNKIYNLRIYLLLLLLNWSLVFIVVKHQLRPSSYLRNNKYRSEYRSDIKLIRGLNIDNYMLGGSNFYMDPDISL
ncbi:hypothetical protein RCL_jg21538.t1 [Rhizophagus clarus]|uniref:Uncharacterized protein n=1 Tax=Rhizophagus clarus TaxID=94130 RepID=A0A8H3KZ11_9GLOM|nr:hypothetical protein RCL_jg21538.t1 [Rhizophagus clarus]